MGITEHEHDNALDEASIAWSESGASREYDADYEAFIDNFLECTFGTDWYLLET